MPCRTDICKGACCRFLVFNFDKKLSDDIKYFLKLHNVEVSEVWVTKFHRRMLKTLIQVPLPCSALDMGTFKCKVYDKRPDNCKDNKQLISPFLPKEICSVLTPALLNLSEEEVEILSSGKTNNKDGKHTS